MIIEITSRLFQNYIDEFTSHKHLRNVLLGGLNNKLGSLFVDDLENPKEFYYCLHVNVWFVAGTITREALKEIKNDMNLPALLFLANDQQLKKVKIIFTTVKELERTDFSSKHLLKIKDNFLLPRDYQIKLVDKEIGLQIDSANFPDDRKEEFTDGISYSAFYKNILIGFVTTNQQFNYEIDVWVHPDHRRLGIAYILCSKLINHCLDEGISPHWDAANSASVLLAKKLGFTDPDPYKVYLVKSN